MKLADYQEIFLISPANQRFHNSFMRQMNSTCTILCQIGINKKLTNIAFLLMRTLQMTGMMEIKIEMEIIDTNFPIPKI